ncbi:MAG: hypothetical protein JXA14_03780 [Anaerolineae bacterium]|nr:hypothetical protein [Anaerolineae bacterium]
MTQRIEQALDKCLERATRPEDIEAILRQYPQQADQLRPLLGTAVAARRHYDTAPEPPPGKLAAGRTRLLAEAARYKKQAAVVPVRPGKPATRRRFALKFAAAFLTAALILASVGTGVAWAAQDSLPGDTLYPVKLTVEDLRLSLVSDPAAETSLALQLGEERVQELQALAESGRPIPESVVARMQNLLGYALQRVSQAPPEEASGLLEQIALRTQTQAQILERLQADGEGDQFRLRQAWQSCLQVHEAAQTRMGHPPSSPPTPPTGKPEATPAKPDTAGPTGEPVQEREQEQEGKIEGEGEGEQEQKQNREQEQEQLQQQQQTQPAPPEDPGPHGTPGPHKDEHEKPEEPGGKGTGTPEPKGPKEH